MLTYLERVAVSFGLGPAANAAPTLPPPQHDTATPPPRRHPTTPPPRRCRIPRSQVTSGIHNVFVLSTQTMQWFQERGFNEVDLESLPESRQAIYNHQRGSKVYMKHLRSLRDVDAEEHFLGQKL